MALRLKGSSSGYAEIDAAAVAGDVTLTLPSTTGTINVKDGSGTTNVGTGVNLGNPGANIFTISNTGGERLRIAADGSVSIPGNLNISGVLTYEDVTSVDAIGLSTFRDGLITKDVGITTISSSISDTAVDVFVYDTSKDSDGGAWRKRTSHTSWYNEEAAAGIRGSRKEFPAVAVIVATVDKVTIYDGDDPDMPMWMVFQSSGYGMSGVYMFNAESVVNSSIYALNGILVGGQYQASDHYGSPIINFISEKVVRMDANTSEGGLWLGNIADRNSGKGYASQASTGQGYTIISSIINDVAMTVLPNAPIDDTTGLPVPTIAVATDGGVSVIKDDGTVVDYTGFSPSETVAIDSKYVYSATRSGTDDYIFKSLFLSADASYGTNITAGSGGWYANSVINGSETPTLKNMTVTDVAITKDSSVIRSGNDGIEVFDGNVTTIDGNEAIMPFAYITSDYNTGWMHGDVKGAFLSGISTVSMPELVTNGTFDSNTNGWTAYNSVASVDSNRLKIDDLANSGGWSSVVQQVATVIGKTYQFRFTYTSSSDTFIAGHYAGSYASAGAGTQPTSYTDYGTTSGTYTRIITATTTTTSLVLSVNNNGVSFVDNVSFKLLEEDRSVNNNGLQVVGTITKSAVATGAELVSYSGFSASNNLIQPYNSDLNFGTGDFSVIAWIKRANFNTNHYVFDRNDGSTESDRWSFIIDTNGTISLYSGATNAQCNSGSILSDIDVWRMIMVKRSGGVVTFGVNGVEYSSTTTNGNWTTASINGSGNENLVIGQYGGGTPGNLTFNVTYDIGSIANFRISASAPTAEQVKKMYEDEKVLFQENAKATLYGSSDAVTALAYDEVTDQLHVGTSSGRSDFQGLRRINNTTQQVETAISAHDTFIIEQ